MTPAELARRVRAGIEPVVVGADELAFAFLACLLAGGHLLIEGVPGTAKTLFVRTAARLLGVEFRRIQFTPDLMPADVVGTTVFDPRALTFSLRRGPVFTNVLLADEINRTPAKTQAALLEAMQERHVTLDGQSVPLGPLFIVCATQNPIEFEGTYPLPEAQLDRFFMRATAGYPAQSEELTLLARAAAGFDADDASAIVAVAGEADVLAARAATRAVLVAPPVVRYLYGVIAATRAQADVLLGASPRAGVALLAAAQAASALDERDFVTPDDVKRVAPLVLAHRLRLRPEAELDGIAAGDVVARVLQNVAVPTAE